MTIKYVLPKDTKQLNAIILVAIEAANTMKAKVQIAAVAILHHAFKHGDYSKANELVEGLGHGVKRDSLVAYFVKYGGLIVAEDASGFNGWKGKVFIKDNFDMAKEKMWYDEKKDSGFNGFVAEDEALKLIKKIEAQRKALPSRSDDEKAKVDLGITDSTIQRLLALIDLEVVIEEPQSDDPVKDKLISALEAA